MVGRFADTSVYKEIFRSRDFIRVSLGTLLIPAALLTGGPFPTFLTLGVSSLLLLLSIALNGLPIIWEALRGVVKRQLNVDELVSLAVIACIVDGSYLEGAVVSAIMVVGALAEEGVSNRSRRSIEQLIASAPQEAILEEAGGERTVPVKELKEGDVVLVKAGEQIPVDGTIAEGWGHIDESTLTGESLPLYRRGGDRVSAGTLNTEGFLRVRSDRTGEDSTIGRIIALVQEAEGGRVESARIVDDYAKWFTPVILAAAVLVFLFTGDLRRATTVLIVGCPCSFLLTGPVTTVAAVGRAARAGILVKGGVHMERVARARAFFFDKTGTVTPGEPELVSLIPAEGVSEEEALGYAAAVEKGSLHPLARAILKKARSLGAALPPGRDIRTLPGQGVEGWVGERKVFVGKGEAPAGGADTAVSLRVDGREAAVFRFRDLPREEAPRAVAGLRALGIDRLGILSGDHQGAVAFIAEELGMEQSLSGLSPEDKLEEIRRAGGEACVFVGDGLNDAPALKAAGTGIAMGLRGSDAALETADIVLLQDRLDRLPFLVRLSRRMRKTIQAGILVSFGINVLSLIAASAGLLTPVWGAVSHNAGSILVVFLAGSLAFVKEE